MYLYRASNLSLNSNALSRSIFQAFIVVDVLDRPYVCLKFRTVILGYLGSVILIECSDCEVPLRPTLYLGDHRPPVYIRPDTTTFVNLLPYHLSRTLFLENLADAPEPLRIYALS